jgi:outer membrane protease
VVDFFTAAVWGYISPWAWAKAIDEHRLTGNVYKDKPHSGFVWETGLSVSCQLTKLLRLSLYGSYKCITGARGPGWYQNETSYLKGKDDWLKYSFDSAGAGFWAWDAGLGLTFCF